MQTGRTSWSEEICLELVQRTESFLGVTYTTSVLRWPALSSASPRRGDVAVRDGVGELAIAACTEVNVQGDEHVLGVQTGEKQVVPTG